MSTWPGRGASGGLAGAWNLKIRSSQKPGPTSPTRERFRLIVDAWATFDPGTCAPPRRTLDDAVSPSTIRLKRASTIAEIRSRRARSEGQHVVYVTERTVFELTADGLQLMEVPPGVDLQKDVLERMSFKVALHPSLALR